MSFLDRLLGRQPDRPAQPATGRATATQPMDEQAIERYRYMLRTAPPEDIERAHAEAFARLTPEQRQAVLGELSSHVPESEARSASADDPQSLARLATRAEMRQPGTLERSFGSMAVPGMGLGGMFLATLAGSFVGTAIAQSFFAEQGYEQGMSPDSAEPGADAADTDASQAGYEGSDLEGGEAGGDDYGGGDFGGGDFGGGDFGGGDL